MSRAVPEGGARQDDRRSREQGQALVELAILLPVIAGLLLWSLDFATVFRHQHTVLQAARFAAWSALREPSPRAPSHPSLQRIAEETRTRILVGLPAQLQIEERSSIEGLPAGRLLGFGIARLGLSPHGKITARVQLSLDRLLQNPAFAGRQLDELRTAVGRTWRARDGAAIREVVARQHLAGASRWLRPAFAIARLDLVRVNIDALPKRKP